LAELSGQQVVKAKGKSKRVEHSAGRSLRAWTIFLSVATLGIAADLISKEVVFKILIDKPGKSIKIVDDVLRFTLSTNPGIVFGIPANRWIVLGATLLAIAAVVIIFLRSSYCKWGLHIGLAMVLAGAVGNGFDRFFNRVQLPGSAKLTGVVRDFIDVRIFGFDYPTFNVADILIVVGVGLIILQTLRYR